MIAPPRPPIVKPSPMNKAVSAASSIVVLKRVHLAFRSSTEECGRTDARIQRMAASAPPTSKPPPISRKSPPVPEPAEPKQSEESGGPKGKEPTRYGDWENKGICWDF